MEAFCWEGFSSGGILQEAFSCGGICAWRDFASKPFETLSCPLVCYFHTLFWDDVTIIYLFSSFCRVKKKEPISVDFF